jgi:hypothetical protein
VKSLLFALALVGCGGQSPEACYAPKLAAVETRYIADAIETCRGYTWEQCPYRARVEAKYDAQREAAKDGCR